MRHPACISSSLQNGTARVVLEQAVNQRPDHSNLVFEQRLPDGKPVNVELPRPNPLVVRLTDLRTGATLARSCTSAARDNAGSGPVADRR